MRGDRCITTHTKQSWAKPCPHLNANLLLDKDGTVKVVPCDHLQVRLTGDTRGKGAFAAQLIAEGTFLGPYEGELLNEAQYWARCSRSLSALDGGNMQCTIPLGIGSSWCLSVQRQHMRLVTKQECWCRYPNGMVSCV